MGRFWEVKTGKARGWDGFGKWENGEGTGWDGFWEVKKRGGEGWDGFGSGNGEARVGRFGADGRQGVAT